MNRLEISLLSKNRRGLANKRPIEAGWEFESAGLGSDGREWFESTKSFADPDDLQKY